MDLPEKWPTIMLTVPMVTIFIKPKIFALLPYFVRSVVKESQFLGWIKLKFFELDLYCRLEENSFNSN